MRAPDILSRPSPAFSASPSSLTHYLSAAALVCTTATRTFHPCVCTQAPKTRYRLPDRFSSRPFSLPPTTSPTCSPLIALYIFSLFFLPFPFSLFFFSCYRSRTANPKSHAKSIESRFHDSIGEMESGDRSPFSASHSLSRRHSKILVGEDRAGSSSRVYIYVYASHEIRQGDTRKNERSIGSRLTTGTTRTGFSSRTGGRRLFFLSLPLSHPPFKPPGPVRAAINKHGSPPRMASVSIRFPINPPPFHPSPPCSGQDSSVCSPPVVTRRCVTRHVRYIYI